MGPSATSVRGLKLQVYVEQEDLGIARHHLPKVRGAVSALYGAWQECGRGGKSLGGSNVVRIKKLAAGSLRPHAPVA